MAYSKNGNGSTIDDLQVEKNVPIPPPRVSTKYPFDQMEVGDSVLIGHGRSRMSAVSAASRYGKNSGRRFTTRTERDGLRIWRVE